MFLGEGSEDGPAAECASERDYPDLVSSGHIGWKAPAQPNGGKLCLEFWHQVAGTSVVQTDHLLFPGLCLSKDMQANCPFLPAWPVIRTIPVAPLAKDRVWFSWCG